MEYSGDGIRAIETVEEMLNYLQHVVNHEPSKLKDRINYIMGEVETKRALVVPMVYERDPGIIFDISDVG